MLLIQKVYCMQLEHLNAAFRGLRPVAMDVFHLLGYVSLNTAGLRKMLKKYAKNVEPSKPQPGMCHVLNNPFTPGAAFTLPAKRKLHKQSIA